MPHIPPSRLCGKHDETNVKREETYDWLKVRSTKGIWRKNNVANGREKQMTMQRVLSTKRRIEGKNVDKIRLRKSKKMRENVPESKL